MRLAKILCRESRGTDEIGWYDARRLCVILPDTSDEGAIAFVQRFTEIANHSGLSPLHNILGYHGQAHSDNERLSAEQIGKGIEEAGQDIQLNPPRRKTARRSPAPAKSPASSSVRFRSGSAPSISLAGH